MHKLKNFTTLLLALAMTAAACLAQDNDKSEPPKFYRLDFVVKELEGAKTVNSRSYYTIGSSHGKGEIRTGSRVPFESSPGQWQQIDVGTNFDCGPVKETQAGVWLYVIAEVSSLLDEAAASAHPTTRNNKWLSEVTLPVGKATAIFSSDDVASKRQMVVELTATPIK